MATSNRPGAVTAISVINLVLGGLGLLGACCLGGYVGFLFSLFAKLPPPKPGEPDFKGLFTNFDQRYPFIKVYFVTGYSIFVLLTLLLVISSFGLLKMKTWGRNLTIAAALGFILFFLSNMICNFAMNMVAIQNDFLKDYQQLLDDVSKKNPGAGPRQQLPVIDPTVGAVSNVVQSLIYCVYPGIIIWIMFLPKVRRAFAEVRGEALPPIEEPEDYRDPPRPESTS